MKGGRRRSRAASRGRSARRSRSASRGRSARRSRSASRGRSARRSRSASRGRRGGMGANGLNVETGHGLAPAGGVDLQLGNVFVKNQLAHQQNGNLIMPKDGIALTSPATIANAQIKLSGGRKRKGRGKKGGFLGQLINQALVPFGLLGMQHAYGKRSRKHRS